MTTQLPQRFETPLPHPREKRAAEEAPMAPPRNPPVQNAELASEAEYHGTVPRKRHRTATFLGETPLRLGSMKELPSNTFQARILSAKIQQDQEWRAKWEVLSAAAAHLDTALRSFTSPIHLKWADLAISEVGAILDRIANLPEPKAQPAGSTAPAVSPRRNDTAAQRITPATPARAPAERAHGGKETKPETSKRAPQAPTHRSVPNTNTTTPGNSAPGTNKEKDWVAVESRKSKAAAREKQPTKTAKPQGRAQKRPSPGTHSDDDRRLFMRLPEDHAYRQLTAPEARASIASELDLEITDIPRALPVKTGWALQGKDEDVRQTIITKGRAKGWTIEESTVWYSYAVADVPKLLRTHNGVKPALEVLPQEIEGTTGRKAQNIRPSHHLNDNADLQNLIVSFTEPVKSGFRLLSSKPARRIEKRVKITQCENCLNFHDGRDCVRAAKCKNCGKEPHGECTIPTRCANCRGPHSYNDLSCQARPKEINGKIQRPSYKQLAALRQLGENSYNEVTTQLNRTREPASQPGPELQARTGEQASEAPGNTMTHPCPNGEADQAMEDVHHSTPSRVPCEITLGTPRAIPSSPSRGPPELLTRLS